MKPLREINPLASDRFSRFKVISEGTDGFSCGLRMRCVSFGVIASWGSGWDHVSVSTAHRCPTWDEMTAIKNVFFRPDEIVMQLHPAEENYVNLHPFCLHMWRPQLAEIPMPPRFMV